MYYTLEYTTLANTVISIAVIVDTFSAIILTDSFTIKITKNPPIMNAIPTNSNAPIHSSSDIFLYLSNNNKTLSKTSSISNKIDLF